MQVVLPDTTNSVGLFDRLLTNLSRRIRHADASYLLLIAYTCPPFLASEKVGGKFLTSYISGQPNFLDGAIYG